MKKLSSPIAVKASARRAHRRAPVGSSDAVAGAGVSTAAAYRSARLLDAGRGPAGLERDQRDRTGDEPPRRRTPGPRIAARPRPSPLVTSMRPLGAARP